MSGNVRWVQSGAHLAVGTKFVERSGFVILVYILHSIDFKRQKNM